MPRLRPPLRVRLEFPSAAVDVLVEALTLGGLMMARRGGSPRCSAGMAAVVGLLGAVLVSGCAPEPAAPPSSAALPSSPMERVVALSRNAGVSAEVMSDDAVRSLAKIACTERARPESTDASVTDAVRAEAVRLGVDSLQGDQAQGIVVGSAFVALCPTP